MSKVKLSLKLNIGAKQPQPEETIVKTIIVQNQRLQSPVELDDTDYFSDPYYLESEKQLHRARLQRYKQQYRL